MKSINPISKGAFLVLLYYNLLATSVASDISTYISDTQPQQELGFEENNDIYFGPEHYIELSGEHPNLQLEKLCFFYNSDNTDCYVRSMNIVWVLDFVYETSLSIHLTSSKMSCKSKIGKVCTIHFKLNSNGTKFELLQSSQLVGKQVIIEASKSIVYIDSTSSIDVSGKSDETTGTQSNYGAAFNGEGGYCGSGENQKTYGSYKNSPNFGNIRDYSYQIGSRGSSSDANSNGGGRIVVLADSIKFTGSSSKLIANAYPVSQASSSAVNGGSGGYIYVQVAHSYSKSTVDAGSRISANGGFGTNGANGGAGGQIIITKLTINSEYVQAQPGVTLKSNGSVEANTALLCKNGGPGVIYYTDLDILTINSNGTYTTKAVYVTGNTTSLFQSFKTLELKQYARLILKSVNTLNITSQLRTNPYSALIVGTNTTSFTLNLGFQAFLDQNTFFNFSLASEVKIYSVALQIFSTSGIVYRNSLNITSSNAIVIACSLQPLSNSTTSNYLYLQSKGDINITLNNSKISAAKIQLISSKQIYLGNNVTISTQSFLKQPLIVESGIQKLQDIYPSTDYDLYLKAGTLVNLGNANMTGGLVGITGQNIQIGYSQLRARTSSSTNPSVNLYATQNITFNYRAMIRGNKIQIQADSVRFLDGITYDGSLSLTNSKPILTDDAANFQFSVISYTKPLQILGTNSTLRSPNVLLMSQTSNIFVQNIYIIAYNGFSGKANLNISCPGNITISNSTDIDPTSYQLQLLSNQSIFIKGLNVSGYNAAIVTNGSIIGSGLNISSTNITVDGNLRLTETTSSYDQPILYLVTNSSLSLRNGDVILIYSRQFFKQIKADQIYLLSNNSMNLYNITMTTSAYKSLSSILQKSEQSDMSLMATTTDNDLVLVTNGTVNFTTVNMNASSTYFNGTSMTLNNVQLTATQVRTDPTILFNASSSISMLGTNFVTFIFLRQQIQFNGSRVWFIANTSISNAQSSFIYAYVQDYANGNKPSSSSDFQVFMVANNSINLNSLNIKSYHTNITSDTITFQDVVFNRFSESDTNYLNVVARNKLTINSYRGYNNLSLSDFDIKVLTSATSVQSSTLYSFRLLTNGSLQLSGNNRYTSSDLYIVGEDISINFITLLITNYIKGPDPTIFIQATGNLKFTQAASLSGGNIILQGYKGISFADQTSILSNKIMEDYPSYGLNVLTNGTINCTDCHFACQNIIISAKDLVGQIFKVESDDDSIGPSINIQIQNKIALTKQVLFYGAQISVIAMNGIQMSNIFANNSNSTNYGFNKTIFFRSKNGTTSLSNGYINGQMIQLEGYSLSINDMIIQGQAKSIDHNLVLYANTTLYSSKNTTLYGGKIYLIGYQQILLDQGIYITSNSSLISTAPPLLLSNLQQFPNQPAKILSASNEDINGTEGLPSIDQYSIFVAGYNNVTLNLGNLQGLAIGFQAKDFQIYNTTIQTDLSTNFTTDLVIQSQNTVGIYQNSMLKYKRLFLKGDKSINIENSVTFLGQSTDSDNINLLKYFTNITSEGPIKMSGLTMVSNYAMRLYSSNSISISNSFISMSDLNGTKSYIRATSEGSLNIDTNSQIEAGTVVLQGAKEINLKSTKLNSTINHTCNMDTTTNSELFYCIKKSSLDTNFSEDVYKTSFKTQYNIDLTYANESYPYIEQNFTTFLISYGTVNVDNSIIGASRIGVCTSNFKLSTSLMDARGRGCSADTGIGKGFTVEGCSGTGASHAGAGGYGSRDFSVKKFVNCQNNYPQAYATLDIDVEYDGSGGGSGNASNTKGGDGGGVIWLSSADQLSIQDSVISVDGTNGTFYDNLLTEGSGGGSGGSIQIITSHLDGNSLFSLKGGDGTTGGGGGGSGGRIAMSFLGNYLADFYSKRTYHWEGSLDLKGGVAGSFYSTQKAAGNGSNGTEWHPKCLGGYSGAFCEPCPIGTFKYGYSYGKCVLCENKPLSGYYTDKAWQNANCPYACDAGLDPVEVNEDCLSQVDLQIQRLGDSYFTLALLGVFLFLSLVQWLCLVQRQVQKRNISSQKKMKVYLKIEEHESLMSEITQNTQGEDDKNGQEVALLEKKKPNLKQSIEMDDPSLWYHYYRLYLIGSNSIKSPWTIPRAIPQQALNEQDMAKLEQLISHNMANFKWSKSSALFFSLLQIIYPPIAGAFHGLIKRRNYTKLKILLMKTFEQEFFENHVDNLSLRVLCSKKNYTLGHIDFLDFSKSFQDYKGPRLPMTVLVSGTGTYNNPYNVDYESDPYVKSIVMINKKSLRHRLPMFFENLDSLLRRLSFYKFTGQIIKDLDTLLGHVDFGNKRIFNPIDVKMTLYVFEISNTKEGSQKRRSFPIDQYLFVAFPHTFEKLIQYVKLKMMRKTSEIKFGIVLSKLNDERKKRQIEKQKILKEQQEQREIDKKPKPVVVEQDQNEAMEMINESEKEAEKPAYKLNFSIQRSDTILGFLSDEDEDGYADSQVENENNFDDRFVVQNQNEEKKQDTPVIKPLIFKDKSQRAFSISKDSSKSMEEALNKPRSKCKYFLARIRSFIYSIYLILFFYQAKPPRRGYLAIYLFYAIFVSLDVVIAMNFTFHLVYPITNLTTFGIAYFAIYPLLPIFGPIFGIFGILISLFAGKVRADLENPHFYKNRIQLKKLSKKHTKGESEDDDEEDDEEDDDGHHNDHEDEEFSDEDEIQVEKKSEINDKIQKL